MAQLLRKAPVLLLQQDSEVLRLQQRLAAGRRVGGVLRRRLGSATSTEPAAPPLPAQAFLGLTCRRRAQREQQQRQQDQQGSVARPSGRLDSSGSPAAASVASPSSSASSSGPATPGALPRWRRMLAVGRYIFLTARSEQPQATAATGALRSKRPVGQPSALSATTPRLRRLLRLRPAALLSDQKASQVATEEKPAPIIPEPLLPEDEEVVHPLRRLMTASRRVLLPSGRLVSDAPPLLSDTVALQPTAPLGFSFSAAGLLFPYHLGVVACLEDHGFMLDNTPLAGSSAGALVCGTVAAGIGVKRGMDMTKVLAADCRANGTRHRLGAVLRRVLEDVLPENAHELVAGRIRVAVTDVFYTPRGVLLSHFNSRQDLIDALVTSCHIPSYLAPQFFTLFRGRYCVDGAVTAFMPDTTGQRTIRVSPFPASQMRMSNVQISPDNNPQIARVPVLELLQYALVPPEDAMLDKFHDDGYQDALVWVKAEQALRKGETIQVS
eukprot:jgi/Chlat1/4928/Chrsp31S04845